MKKIVFYMWKLNVYSLHSKVPTACDMSGACVHSELVWQSYTRPGSYPLSDCHAMQAGKERSWLEDPANPTFINLSPSWILPRSHRGTRLKYFVIVLPACIALWRGYRETSRDLNAGEICVYILLKLHIYTSLLDEVRYCGYRLKAWLVSGLWWTRPVPFCFLSLFWSTFLQDGGQSSAIMDTVMHEFFVVISLFEEAMDVPHFLVQTHRDAMEESLNLFFLHRKGVKKML